MSTAFVRQCLTHLAKKGVLELEGTKLKERYKFAGKPDEETAKDIEDLYGEVGEKLPAKVMEYHSEYGFQILVANVAKWIDFEGKTVREYNIDRLWLGRYIDFLDKAREYLKWYESDQAIAVRRQEALRKEHAKAKAKK